jgi:phage terminase small subunit
MPASTAARKPLNSRQRDFVQAYLGLARYNASKAAEMVGYRWPGKTGPRLLSFPNVSRAIRVKQWKRLDAEERAYEEAGRARLEAYERQRAENYAAAQRRCFGHPSGPSADGPACGFM